MPRLSLDDLPPHYRRQAEAQFAPVAPGLCHPLPKQDAILPSLGADKDEEGGAGRFKVRITRRGARLLDADNAAGAVKYLLDACRYEGLVPDDSPQAIELEVCQEVVTKAERGTLVEITPL